MRERGGGDGVPDAGGRVALSVVEHAAACVLRADTLVALGVAGTGEGRVGGARAIEYCHVYGYHEPYQEEPVPDPVAPAPHLRPPAHPRPRHRVPRRVEHPPRAPGQEAAEVGLRDLLEASPSVSTWCDFTSAGNWLVETCR